MADYAFLVGLSQPVASFWHDDADEEIAYACDWVPLAWLAMFDPENTLSVDDPSETPLEKQLPYTQAQTQIVPDPNKRTCPTLFREKEAALITYRRRWPRLQRVLPADLMSQLSRLESAVQNARSPYIQVVVTDLDLYVSFDDSKERLRRLVSIMESDNLEDWRILLSHLQAELGSEFGEVRYPQGVEIPAVVGYLPENDRPSSSGSAPRQAKPVSSKKGNGLFTRSSTGGEGWRAYIDPRYLKVLAGIIIAVIVLAVVNAI